MNTHFITDEQGNRISIVIPIKEYNQMIEDLEEFHDVKLYDEVKERQEDSLPLEDYLKKRSKFPKNG